MKRSYLLTVLVGIVFSAIHGLMLFLFDSEALRVPPQEQADAKVLFIGAQRGGMGQMLELEMQLRDSTPLFMPTPYNAASDLSGLRRLQDAAEAFSAYMPDLLLPAEPLPHVPRQVPDLIPGAFLPEDASFLLSRYQRQPLDPIRAPEPNRLILLARCLDCAKPSETRHFLEGINFDRAPQGIWQPLVAFVQLVQGRPVGPALVSARSGYPDWDAYLFTEIMGARTLAALENGYYQITLEPSGG